MRKLLEKYLKISLANDEIEIALTQDLKDSIARNALGRYLYETYGIVKIFFAEPNYMQFKFVFECIPESFKLLKHPVQYTEGKKINLDPVSPYDSSEKRRAAHKILMEKAIGNAKDGWLSENIMMAFDESIRKKLVEESKPKEIKVKEEVEQEDKKEVAQVKKENEIPKEKIEAETSSTNVIIGDSQIQGNIGIELQKTFGGFRLGKPSTKPSDWISLVSEGEVKAALDNNPPNIFMLFGGNGAKGTKDLIDKVSEISPSSMIHFLSPPPPASPSSNIIYDKRVFGRTHDYSKLLKSREKNARAVMSGVTSSKAYSEGKVKFIYIFDIPWTCEKGCDGIHVTPKAAKEIVSTISVSQSPLMA